MRSLCQGVGRRVVLLAGSTLVFAFSLAACSSSAKTVDSSATTGVSPPTTGMSPPTTSMSPPTTGMSPPTTGMSPPTTGMSTTTTTSLPQRGGCRTSDLSLTVATGFSAGGSGYTGYYLTYSGSTTCMISGYPGVAVLNAQGVVVQHAAQRSIYADPSPTPVAVVQVTLKSGQRVQFFVSSSLRFGTSQCPKAFTGTTLQVYPPDQTAAILQPYKGELCDLQVGPVQPAN
jgi:hypothetical protein